MPIETLPWDAADYLKSPEDELAYLEAAVEDGDPRLVAAALGDIARARGMSQIAKGQAWRALLFTAPSARTAIPVSRPSSASPKP